MNSVSLIGRITRDVELRQTEKGNFVLNFTLAVDKVGSEGANFISCVVWREYAGKMSKLLYKGQQIGVDGKLNTRTYDDKNGTKHYITEVYVEHITLLGKKPDGAEEETNAADDIVLDDIPSDGIPL